MNSFLLSTCMLVVQIGELDSNSSQNPPLVITLPQAQAMAAKHNPSFKNIEETVVRADLLIQTAWSMLVPHLSATGSVVRNQRQIEIGVPNFAAPTSATGEPQVQSMVIQELWDKSYGVSANMTLFNPRSIPAISMAYEMAEQMRLQAKAEKNTLLFAVTAAFYQMHSFHELIEATEANLIVAKEFLRMSKAQANVGQATRIDELRAEIQVKQAENEFEKANDGLAMAKTAFSYLVGVKGDFEIDKPKPVTLPNVQLDGLTRQALEQRAEIQAATLAESIANKSELESWMQWLPTFDATFSWRWASAAGFSGSNENWLLTFGAKWSLFEGGSRIAEIRSRASETRSSTYALEQLSLDIKKEVEQSLQHVHSTKRNVDVAHSQLSMAEENHRLISKQYQVGMVSSLDLLDAATQLSSTRINRVLEQIQFDMAMLSLEKAIGEYHSLTVE